MNKNIIIIFILLIGVYCNKEYTSRLVLEVYQSSADGDQFKQLEKIESKIKATDTVSIFPEETFQTISGFGGAFTESSAYLLNQMSQRKRKEILDAYFSTDGANYSLTRTHMNSCDFSIDHYSYTEIENDTLLEHFSIEADKDDIIPMIHEAQEISDSGFKIIASPWTAPPWMKDNNEWNGGKLKKEYYASWANFFVKYANAYKEEGINIWAFTVENEPLGNGANWESMHYTPEEMVEFVKNHLGPTLKKEGSPQEILVYDQNRGEELREWAEVLLKDKELLPYIYGTAVHWYTSTNDWMPASLNYTHYLAPQKHIIHTEGCVDAEVPKWKDDAWYWKKEATDWGYDWAPEEDKKDHPKYVPVYRYARDIIGCLNSWVEGWVDWNMVLDQNGGPNLAKNWCIAPVIVNTELDEVYYTPLYYTMKHFSKFIRPGAQRIKWESSDDGIMTTAAKNEDGSIVVVLLNMNEKDKTIILKQDLKEEKISIKGEAIQTIVIEA